MHFACRNQPGFGSPLFTRHSTDRIDPNKTVSPILPPLTTGRKVRPPQRLALDAIDWHAAYIEFDGVERCLSQSNRLLEVRAGLP